MNFRTRPQSVRQIGWAACFLVVFLSAFSLSGTQPPPLELDPSWYAALEYATAHHLQFGSQIVFTFGPLGFLAGPMSLGHLVGLRIAFAFFWAAVVALTATAMAKLLPGWVGYVLLVWLVALTLSEGLDQTAFWVMAAGTLILLIDNPRQRWQGPIYALAFAVLSLVKSSFLTAALASLALVVICWIVRRRFLSAVCLVLGTPAAFIAGWMALGQSPSHLAPWIRYAFELQAGYSGAMSLVPKAPVLYTAIAGLALLAGALITATRRARRSLLAWCAIVTVAMYGFLAWKEGFTRSGDWHTFVFLWYLPLGLAFLFLHEFASGSEVSHQRVLEVAFAASMSLCLLAAHFQIPGLALQQATGWPQRIAHSAKAAFTILRGSANGLYAGCRDPGNLQMLRLDHARDVIGNESVDVMNYLLLAAVGNDMNYQPRPVIQGFVAYTPTLQALNEKYFQSPGRPHFVMLCQESTDNRFPALEDSAALNYILNNYAPAARDGKFLILKQRTAEDPTFKLMHEERVQFSEPLDLRPWARKALFLSVVIKPSLLGRVAELLYQQHPLYMQVSRNQEVERFRIVPSMAERPFLLNPVLKSNYDVLNFYASQPGKVVDSVTFERPGAASLEFQDQLTVRLYAAPAFPRAMKGVPVPRMLADVQGRVFWPRPKSFESAAPARLMIFHGTAAIMVRDPSKIVMEIPENANSFSGYFGVPQEANPGSANAAGVLISIVVQDDAGRIRWRLDRVAQPGPSTHDHGRIAFRVPIDSSQDRTITLTTGPANGGKGGWSVWSQCRFDNARCAAGALECGSGSYRLSYRTPISSAN